MKLRLADATEANRICAIKAEADKQIQSGFCIIGELLLADFYNKQKLNSD